MTITKQFSIALLSVALGSVQVVWASNLAGDGSGSVLSVNTAALSSNVSGLENTAFGNGSLMFLTSGSYNVGVGHQALEYTNGTGNTAIGHNAMRNHTSATGIYNIALGYQSGYNATGSRNVFIGYNAGLNETGDDKLYIDNRPDGGSPLIYGDFATNELTVNGTFYASGGITDASGNNVISKDSNGAIHIGENSLVTIESNGQQYLYATDASSNAIDINVNNGSDLLVNGKSVMGSISSLGDGVEKTTAMTAAITALPNFAESGSTQCGMGVGHYSSRSALAGGCAYGLSDQVSLNFGASHVMGGSTDYGVGNLDSTVYRAGITMTFGDAPKTDTSSATISQLRNDNLELRAEVSRLKKLEDQVALLSVQFKQLQAGLLKASSNQVAYRK